MTKLMPKDITYFIRRHWFQKYIKKIWRPFFTHTHVGAKCRFTCLFPRYRSSRAFEYVFFLLMHMFTHSLQLYCDCIFIAPSVFLKWARILTLYGTGFDFNSLLTCQLHRSSWPPPLSLSVVRLWNVGTFSGYFLDGFWWELIEPQDIDGSRCLINEHWEESCVVVK